MFKIKIHSVVDVITNSSTTIFTYQNDSIEPAKELIDEILKLAGITDKKADDIFYFGVFCQEYEYIEYIEEECIEGFENFDNLDWGSPEYDEAKQKNYDKLKGLFLSIMKGEIEKPDWMISVEDGISNFAPNSLLWLEPKDPIYEELGLKISSLLCSVSADGGYN